MSSPGPRYVEVAVNSPGAGQRCFTYEVPPGLDVALGHAVWVPFGPATVQGVVLGVDAAPPEAAEARPIAGLIDRRPLLDAARASLARWLSREYLAPLFEAVALLLPPGFERRVLTYYAPAPDPSELALASLSAGERQVLAQVQRGGEVEGQELGAALGARKAAATLGQLLRKKLVVKVQRLEGSRVREKVVRQARLLLSASAAAAQAQELRAHRAPRQAAALELLAVQPAPLPVVIQRTGVGRQALEKMAQRGWLALEQVRVVRDPLARPGRLPPGVQGPPLTTDQDDAWARLRAALEAPAAPDSPPASFLLYGVTGSGKTELYLRALAQVESQGRSGIVLVPEISLTPQAIARFSARFPGRVAVLHSRLSLGEQFDEWWRVLRGDFTVVIGPRGALFAPLRNLGLIVLDEEHEPAYKQWEQPPRYHAREAALELARLTGAAVVLGSATPDVGSMWRSEAGLLQRLELPQRVLPPVRQQPGLAQVEVVDLRRELKEGNRGIFSRALLAAARETLERGEQAILFLNRRGSATFVQCRDCGHVLKCHRCDVVLTYHSAQENLVCHQCSARAYVPAACSQCFSRHIRYFGLGTERVEEEAARAFPAARLLRWDRDAARFKGAHDRLLERFASHGADILIGTQLIAMGLDLPLVTLVGVISADTALHLPDFRAGERTFQLLTQVVGRAGRGERPGRAIVQTYTPDHYAIRAAAVQDYRQFYRQELEHRREHDYPPLNRLTRLVFQHPSAGLAAREAERVARELRQRREALGRARTMVLGPAPAYVSRLRGRYRWQVLIKGPAPQQLLEDVALGRGWAVDVDPLSFL
ncbi:MAG: primosomal protein N' [Chloroflexi bacterium]|nr:primosomal protein N' [Chloroflexota bacterium]